MTFKDLSALRSSVRSFTSEEVDAQQLDYILECARLAPSAVNKQPWHFYVVTSPEGKAALRKCYNREWFAEAPVYIVCCVCHDQEWVRSCDNKPHGNIDIAIATEHICLAAAEQGLGSCWVCNFDVALCKQLLNLPDNQEPSVIVPIGHASPQGATRPKQRKNAQDIISKL